MIITTVKLSEFQQKAVDLLIANGSEKSRAESTAELMYSQVAEGLAKGILIDNVLTIPDGIALIFQSVYVADQFYWVLKDKYIPIKYDLNQETS